MGGALRVLHPFGGSGIEGAADGARVSAEEPMVIDDWNFLVVYLEPPKGLAVYLFGGPRP